ncbi:MAG TPA: MBL fold metallo-hydrolase [Deferrisomatales bacterium]|nr:MBL fold metallo-hydrolase [Deferrisomatales bacterium]
MAALELTLVDLDQPALEGFREFIGAWIVRGPDSTLVVDPGPASTIPVLLDALGAMGIRRLDGVLLTHIHIDHAGGAGLLLGRFPTARALCHPKGIPHLVDPEKLWQGSRKVLGKVAEAYGPIARVPEDRIGFAETSRMGGLTVVAIDTPGHAAHHLCYQVGDVLFAGEVAGIGLDTPEGPYRRPATPPRFQHEVSRASLEATAAVPASCVCLGHRGQVEEPAPFFGAARDQLDHWVAVARRHLEAGSAPWEEAVVAELLATDPLFGRLRTLPPDIQARERYFTGNALQGMREYLEAG